jgi:hypothetical protein
MYAIRIRGNYGMKKLTATVKQTYFLLTTLLIVSSITVAGCTKIPLSLQIDSPEDGAEFSVNVQKVSGVVSDPKATVQVNGIEAGVDQNGDFYAYVEFNEGENTIKAEAIRGRDNYFETLIVTFTPPLAVYIDIPVFGINYLQNPLAATGRVSHTEATVTVNGFPATVFADGNFNAQVQLTLGNSSLTAVATLGDKTESMAFRFMMTDQGTLVPGPGQFNIFNSEYNRLVQIEAGKTFTQEMVLDIHNSTREPSSFNYQLTAVVNVNDKHTPVPWPEGLEVSITPASFLVYPNAVYSSLMVVKAAPELPSGEYLFQIESQLSGGGSTRGIIKVVVLPPGGAIEKTVTVVNLSQTVNGITFTFERVELSDAGMKVYAFNTPPDYSLPQGPELAPPQFMALHASASYTVDGGTANSAGISGIQFLDNGMRHVWSIDLPVVQGSKELEFTISNLGDWHGPWRFAVPLE